MIFSFISLGGNHHARNHYSDAGTYEYPDDKN
jgi:hypothetical protein